MTKHKDTMDPELIDGALYFVKPLPCDAWSVMVWRNGGMVDDRGHNVMTRELSEIGPMVLMPDQMAAQAAEIATLRAELEELDFLCHEGGPDSVAAMEKELIALRAERDRDHANINLKADFIAATIDQLAQMEAERDAALARVLVLTELLVRNMVFDLGSADEGLNAVGGWPVVDKIMSDRAALANKGATE
jgi:hypothetical protein